MSARATLLIAAVAGGVCLVLAAVMLAAILDRDRPGGTVKSIVTAAGIEIGGPFELIDHHGRAVTEANFLGSYLLVYFGFGYCPDVCPTELQNIGLAMDELGADAARVTPVFITVDPERDTVEFIKDYVAAFHPRKIGLTGDAQAIDLLNQRFNTISLGWVISSIEYLTPPIPKPEVCRPPKGIQSTRNAVESLIITAEKSSFRAA